MDPCQGVDEVSYIIVPIGKLMILVKFRHWSFALSEATPYSMC